MLWWYRTLNVYGSNINVNEESIDLALHKKESSIYDIYINPINLVILMIDLPEERWPRQGKIMMLEVMVKVVKILT